MEENDLLEKIFIAISEKLLATLLRMSETLTYQSIQFDENLQPTFANNANNVITVENVERSLELSAIIGENRYTTDSEHKLDCVIQSDDSFFAVELKAGNAGPAASLKDFAKYCSNNKVRVRGSNPNYIDGCMSAFLSKFTDIENLSVGFRNRNQETVLVNDTWIVCFRRSPTDLPGPRTHRNTLETFHRIFSNCRILSLEVLILNTHANRDAFINTMRTVLPLDTTGVVAKYIWGQLNILNQN